MKSGQLVVPNYAGFGVESLMAEMSTVSRRSFFGAAAGAGLFLAGCGSIGGSGRPKLRASTTGKGDSNTEQLLKVAGLAPDDFDIDYSDFSSGHLVVEALNSGALDIGRMSEIPPVFAAASTTQSFRQIAIIHGDVNNQVVLLPKGSPIRSIADLKGKRVGYVRATTAQYFLIRMLEEEGLSWEDIDASAMTVSDGAAAFSRGSLDAWAIYGFAVERAIATEGATILRTALGILSGNYLLVAHVDALADPEKVDIIGQYLNLLQRGYAWVDANQDEWISIVAKDIGVPREYVVEQYRRRSANYEIRPVTTEAAGSQQQVAAVFEAAGLLPAPVDVAPLWDDRFNDVIRKGV